MAVAARVLPELRSERQCVDRDIFEEALEIISDEQYDFLNEVDNILGEGLASDIIIGKLKQIDYQSLLGRIFDLFIGSIDQLSGSFCAFLLNFVNDDAELKLYKNKLSTFRGEVHYNKPYYEYRNFQSDSSISLNYKNNIESVYNSLISEFTKMRTLNTKEEILNVLNSILQSTSNDQDDLDAIRGKLVGTNTCTSDVYSSSLFNYFRNTTEPINPNAKFFEKNIKGDRVYLAYSDYYSSSKQISAIKREQWKYKAQATAEKSKIRTINPMAYIDKSLITADSLLVYNRIINSKCKKIKIICDIYVLYFGAKLNAIREYNHTNKEILLLACKEIVKQEKSSN